METAEQNTKQIMEENEVLKQLIELLNQQDMDGRSQDFMGIFWYVAGMQMQLTRQSVAKIMKSMRNSLSGLTAKASPTASVRRCMYFPRKTSL